MAKRYGSRDDQWQRIEHLLPGRAEMVGMTAKDNRLFVEAVLYRYRRAFPRAICRRGSGISDDPSASHALEQGRGCGGGFSSIWRPIANEYAMIDATIICAHQASAGAKACAEHSRSEGTGRKKRSGAARAD